jgi:hypothetical protein
MVQMMEKREITENGDDETGTIDDFFHFAQEIYLNCKNLGTMPSSIFSCFKDLIDFGKTLILFSITHLHCLKRI